MADKLGINTKATTVSNSKTKAQSEELEKLKKQKADAETKAKKAQSDALKEKEEKAKAKEKEAEKSSSNNKDEAIELAKSLVTSVSNSKAKTSITKLLSTFVLGVIVGALLMTFFGGGLLKEVNEGKETVDQIIDENFIGYTALDFKDAVLGAAIEKQDLIVMEQPLSIETTITKSGLGNLAIFSKTKNIMYSGEGVYTINLSKIDSDHIDVDMDNKVVKIMIPHTELQYVNLDVNNIQFEDTEKGMLAFGDLSLTAEQVNEIEVAVRASMEERLNAKELFAQADEIGSLKTWQIFQPLVSAVSPEFTVEMIYVD